MHVGLLDSCILGFAKKSFAPLNQGMHHTSRRAKFTVRGNYFRCILSTHTVNSARHMLKKFYCDLRFTMLCVCITAHIIAARVSPISLLLRMCAL